MTSPPLVLFVVALLATVITESLVIVSMPASAAPAVPPRPIINLSCPVPECPAAPACPACSCTAARDPDLPLLVLDVWAVKDAHRYRFATESESPYVCKNYARDLFVLLKSHGFRPEVCYTKTHAWVELSGMVLDLTLEQPFVPPEGWKDYDGFCSSMGAPEWWFE